LGIEPHFEPWKYFFTVSLHKRREKKAKLSVPVGCTSIHLWSGRAAGYNSIVVIKSNKGWHKLGFYLNNDTTTCLLEFTGCTIEEVPDQWGHDPVEKEKRRLYDLIDVVTLQRSGSVHGASILGAYHARGVAPLMACTLSLFKMTPNAPLEETVLALGPHRNSKIKQCIRDAIDVLDDTFKFLISSTLRCAWMWVSLIW
jgi:hypothetical protein